MLKWENLFLNGSVIDLTVSVWRARLQLKLADLGLEKSEEASKALSLGCHRLAPHEAFEEVLKPASLASRLVDSNSLKFPMIDGARFVPKDRLPKLLEELKACREEFDAAVEKFIANYETVKAEMLPVIKQALLEAAKDEETAARAYQRVCDEYPSAETVRGKFGLSWKIYAITGVNEGTADALQEEATGVRDMVSSMMGGLREELQTRVAEVVDLATKGGKLNQRTINVTLELCDRLDNLNIMGDATLRNQVKALRGLLNGLDKANVDGDAIAGFEAIKTAIKEDLDAAVAAAEQRLTALGKRRLVA